MFHIQNLIISFKKNMISKLIYISLFVFVLYAIILALGSNSKYPEKVYYNNFFPLPCR